MEVKRLRSLALEIYKTMNNLNPEYMKDLFCVSKYRTSERLKMNIESKKFKQIRYVKNSLRVLGPILWNSLPNDAKPLPTAEYSCKNGVLMGVHFIKNSCHMLKQQNNS